VNGDDGSFGACSNGQICDGELGVGGSDAKRARCFPVIVALSAGTGFEGHVDKHHVTFYGSGWLTTLCTHDVVAWHGKLNSLRANQGIIAEKSRIKL